MRWPRSSDSSRRSPRPGSSQCETSARELRPVRRGTTRSRRANPGSASQQLRLERLDGEQRDQADHRAHLQRHRARRRAGAARRRRTRPPRPTARCPRRRCCSSPRRCAGSARRTWSRCPRRPGCRCASSSAIAQHVQAVHRHPAGAVGLLEVPAGRAAARCGRRRRCCRARGSRPGRRCCPSASLRFTHQVKLSSSLWKTRSRKARSPSPRALRSIL